jgi:hypothetical protein
LPLDHP